MDIRLPTGALWSLTEVPRKLTLRARLPGASVFDRVGESLRAAKSRGVTVEDRLALALPASWLVNSPAVSSVLQRWVHPPHVQTCVAMMELFETDPAAWADDEDAATAIRLGITSLGPEPYVPEALSKVLALLVPDAIPLMPAPARAFVLGPERKDEPDAFARIASWFARAAEAQSEALRAAAGEPFAGKLSGAGVLDRLLWFDSEGHTHFPSRAPSAALPAK